MVIGILAKFLVLYTLPYTYAVFEGDPCVQGDAHRRDCVVCLCTMSNQWSCKRDICNDCNDGEVKQKNNYNYYCENGRWAYVPFLQLPKEHVVLPFGPCKGEAFKPDWPCNRCKCVLPENVWECPLQLCREDTMLKSYSPKIRNAHLDRLYEYFKYDGRKEVCSPGETREGDECNKCTCKEDLWWCKLKQCPEIIETDSIDADTLPDHLEIELPPGMKSIREHEDDSKWRVCDPGKRYKKECNTCSCSSDGTVETCTQYDCSKLERYDQNLYESYDEYGSTEEYKEEIHEQYDINDDDTNDLHDYHYTINEYGAYGNDYGDETENSDTKSVYPEEDYDDDFYEKYLNSTLEETNTEDYEYYYGYVETEEQYDNYYEYYDKDKYDDDLTDDNEEDAAKAEEYEEEDEDVDGHDTRAVASIQEEARIDDQEGNSAEFNEVDIEHTEPSTRRKRRKRVKREASYRNTLEDPNVEIVDEYDASYNIEEESTGDEDLYESGEEEENTDVDYQRNADIDYHRKPYPRHRTQRLRRRNRRRNRRLRRLPYFRRTIVRDDFLDGSSEEIADELSDEENDDNEESGLEAITEIRGVLEEDNRIAEEEEGGEKSTLTQLETTTVSF